MAEDKYEHARQQAQAKLDMIKGMVFRLRHAADCKDPLDTDECNVKPEDVLDAIGVYSEHPDPTAEQRQEYHSYDAALRSIEESILSIEVRSAWTQLGEKLTADEYNLLLCTGGPAVRLIGEIGLGGEPRNARLEYQDWFVPWEELHVPREELHVPPGDDNDALLEFARQVVSL